MLEHTLSSFSKVILGVILTVTIVGVATAAVTVSAEKDLNTAKKATYQAKSMNAQRSSMVEGAYWELQDIVTLTDSVEVGRYSLITEIMENLPNYGASYYYSFTDNAVLSFLPVDDPSYAIDLWQKHVADEVSILRNIIPALRADYDEYKEDKPKVSEKFKNLCESLGVPFPSIAVTSYKYFKYEGLGQELAPGLSIASVNAEHMDLAYGRSAVLHYDRIKKLPQEIAPITYYFNEKIFFYENYDKLKDKGPILSDEEIDAHFRKTFKSKKY